MILLTLKLLLLSPGTDRALRPMILTKQFDQSSKGAQVTPGGDLAKDTDKGQPEEENVSSSIEVKFEPKQSEGESSGDVVMEAKVMVPSIKHAPERPNILSRRPHMRNKASMLNRSRSLTGNRILDAANKLRNSSPSSLSSASVSVSSLLAGNG